MEIEAIFTFAVVGSIVWGGFTFFLSKAIKCERNKNSSE